MLSKKSRKKSKIALFLTVGIPTIMIVVGLIVGVYLSTDTFRTFAPPEAYNPSVKKTRYATHAEPHIKRISDLQPATSFRKWIDWYPVDFNQPEGYRVINRWSAKGKKNSYFHGHSVINVPNNIATLPERYNNNPVDYFFLFQCSDPQTADDPSCISYAKYLEVISQGSAVDPVGKTTLEHWARGDARQYEVYYNPSVLGFDSCTAAALKNSTRNLHDPSNKKPWVLKLPEQSSSYYVSEPVCALVFAGYDQRVDRLIDTRASNQGVAPSFETGNWISITVTHDVFQAGGHSVVFAENIYLTDNQNASDRFASEYCRKLQPSDSLRCQRNQNGKMESYAHVVGGREYRAFAFELYYMRKTQSSGRYDQVRAGIVDKYGFGSFRWWSVQPPAAGAQWKNEWDMVDNRGRSNSDTAENQIYDLEKCQLNQWHGIVRCEAVQEGSQKRR
jgi:hypothetical protein